MTTQTQEQPTQTGAGAPPLPVTLRAIAAWLESHPAAEVHFIDAARSPDPWKVIGILAGDDPGINVRMAQIGGTWVQDRRAYEAEIAPHVLYRLLDARA